MKNSKKCKWLLSLLLLCFFMQAQGQLNMGEYFFDTDPGVGNGTPILTQTVSAGALYDSVISSSSIQVPIGMSPGVHTLYVRYGNHTNSGGINWSHYEARKFTVAPVTGNAFVQAEYFFDTDPGLGNGTSIALTGNTDSSSFAGNVSTAGLLPGYHTLHVRAKNVQGLWSNYETRKVKINVSGGSSIVEAEYFYDVDPGVGNATSIALSGNTDSSEFAGNVSTVGLSLGTHQLCIRAKNASGEWSVYETRKIKILSNGNALDMAEYFYDIDPGVGNGNSLAIVHSGDSSTFSGNIPTTGLTAGTHQLFVRARDISGQWSLYENRKIKIEDEAIMAEYFFDTDPGVGQGTSFALTSLGNGESEFTGGIITSAGLSYGPHLIYIRTRNQLGQWGMYDSLGIFINCKVPGLPIVTQTITTQCGIEGIQLTATGNLNDAAYWNWYSGGCGTNLIDTGMSIFVTPLEASTYYVRGEGGCVDNLACEPIAVIPNTANMVALKLFLQGYYIGDQTMQPVLLNQGVASCIGNTDTVEVQLRDPLTYAIVTSQKAILQTNGNVRCRFTGYNGNYYVAIAHRNTLHSCSAAPLSIGSNVMEYDFSVAASQVYGDNQVEVEPNVFAMYTGDLNQDEFIDAFDFPLFDADAYLSISSEYVYTDMNGDGFVDAFDFPIYDVNSSNGITSLHP